MRLLSQDDCSWYSTCGLAETSSAPDYHTISIRPVPPPPPPAPANFTRIAIPRVTVSTGTIPRGSQWVRGRPFLPALFVVNVVTFGFRLAAGPRADSGLPVPRLSSEPQLPR